MNLKALLLLACATSVGFITTAFASQTVTPAFTEFPYQLRAGSQYSTPVGDAEMIFYSTVIEHLRRNDIHVNNSATKGGRPRPDFAGADVSLLTRTFGATSVAGLEIVVTAWPTIDQAREYAETRRKSIPDNDPVRFKTVVHAGLFTAKFFAIDTDKAKLALTQQVAESAMSTYAPRSFTEKLSDKAVLEWHSLNTTKRDQANKLLLYVRQFPNSPHRQDAELALLSLPSYRGATIVNPNEQCKQELFQSMRRVVSLSKPLGQEVTFPEDVFLSTDVYEMGSQGRSAQDTPLFERTIWHLTISNALFPASNPKTDDKCSL